MENRIVMLGAAPETRGSIASVVDTYRRAGLFDRWAVDYIATHADGAPLERVAVWRRAVRAYAARIAQHRRLVAHVHTCPSRLWTDSVFMLSAMLARVPLILHLHGSGFDGLFSGVGTPGRTLLPHLLDRAAAVVVNSDPLRVWITKVTRNANVHLIADPVLVPPATDSAIVPNLVLFLGRLEAESGVFDLVEAVAALRSHIPDVRLVCAGDGGRNAVAAHAARHGVADAVKFTGWVGPSGKRALLQSAAAFALPSYEEGASISLLEAMAAGVASVASRVGGVTDVLVDGVSGFLVPPGDKATLARALRNVLLDRALAARVGAAGRESVRRRCSPERTLPPLEDLYRRLGVTEQILELKRAA
jgi:glycosyltransferase involved in cell wall biosynthesis